MPGALARPPGRVEGWVVLQKSLQAERWRSREHVRPSLQPGAKWQEACESCRCLSVGNVCTRLWPSSSVPRYLLVAVACLPSQSGPPGFSPALSPGAGLRAHTGRAKLLSGLGPLLLQGEVTVQEPGSCCPTCHRETLGMEGTGALPAAPLPVLGPSPKLPLCPTLATRE